MGLVRRGLVTVTLAALAAGACAVPTFGGFGQTAGDGGLPDVTVSPDAMPSPDAGDANVPDTRSNDTGSPGMDSGLREAAPASDACPSTRGPTGAQAGANGCIDTTEVTNAEYLAFLTDVGADAGGEPAPCTWNTDYTPAGVWPREAGTGSDPVAQVNWCDAFMFCKWAGKRLCGLTSGGSVPYDETNLTSDQWYAACSATGAYSYPYGTAYNANACNGDEPDGGHVVAVGSNPECVGGYPGIFDMSGNVAEWEDACEAGAPPEGGVANGASDICSVRGGAYMSAPGGLECTSKAAVERREVVLSVGFRCCWP
jgi:sulfatase modifying factor 1